jgi:hypothetical protein
VTRANSVAIGIPPGKTIEEGSRPHISGHDPYFSLLRWLFTNLQFHDAC